jgi:hypothetical protein
MSYELVLTDPPPSAESAEKDFGENILFSDLSPDYRVYALYFAAEPPDRALEEALRNFGGRTGKNLMIYYGSEADPLLDKIEERFGIKPHPVIVVTALPELASPVDDYVTTYARLESKQLLKSPERTVACLQEIYHLFLHGDVAEAISSAKWKERAELASAVTGVIGKALKAVGGFLAERDFVIGCALGKLELKRSGGK